MIFRQLFEPLSSTYTYLLGCEETGQALLIDPVITSLERDIAELRRLGLTLVYSVETHIHADHITAALELKQTMGSQNRRDLLSTGFPARILASRKASPFALAVLHCSRYIHPDIPMGTSPTCAATGYSPAMRFSLTDAGGLTFRMATRTRCTGA